MKKIVLNPVSMFLIGLVLGGVSRLLDIYTTNLGNIFSGISIWILFGVLISIYSSTRVNSMGNIFPFCIGMLITYYFVAFITNGVYSRIYIIGWSLFAFCSPILAFFTWMCKEKGMFARFISLGIILVSIISTIVFFDRLRFYDFVINGVMIYFLFFKKIER